MKFISENWKTIVAIIALIQPWIIWAWKKYLLLGNLEFYSVGRLEVGYNNYASTLGVNGSIRTVNKDFYVKEITAELTKHKDKSKHQFVWAVLRDTNLNVSQQKIELPYGFIVSDATPYRINVQLHDLVQQETLKTIVLALKSKWNTYVDNNFPQAERLTVDEETYNETMLELFNQFKDDQTSEAHSKITKECYWQAGKYTFVLSISTANRNKKFKFNFDFELTDSDAHGLELNAVNIIDMTLGQPEKTWFPAFPQHTPNYDKD